jgi:hypothetical protein
MLTRMRTYADVCLDMRAPQSGDVLAYLESSTPPVDYMSRGGARGGGALGGERVAGGGPVDESWSVYAQTLRQRGLLPQVQKYEY